MSDGPDNFILAYLRRIDARLDRIEGDVAEMRIRIGGIEGQNGTILSHIGHLQAQWAEMSVRLDRIDGRLTRIETRLDLVGPTHA